MLNVIAIMGRLVADPELRTTQQGTNVCTFRIACERSYTPKGQQRQADFVDIVAWGKTAEFICKFFQKCSMIAIDGSIQTRNYQDKQGTSARRWKSWRTISALQALRRQTSPLHAVSTSRRKTTPTKQKPHRAPSSRLLRMGSWMLYRTQSDTMPILPCSRTRTTCRSKGGYKK